MKELEGLAEEGDSHEGGKNRDEVYEHPGPSRTDHLDAGDEADLRKEGRQQYNQPDEDPSLRVRPHGSSRNKLINRQRKC